MKFLSFAPPLWASLYALCEEGWEAEWREHKILGNPKKRAKETDMADCPAAQEWWRETATYGPGSREPTRGAQPARCNLNIEGVFVEELVTKKHSQLIHDEWALFPI